MAAYRCAFCGSPNVVKSESNGGFSYSKAMVGTAVFGSIGAVAGINGKKTSAYTCPDCGNTLPQPMDNITKDKIDLVMTNPDLLASKIYPTIFADYTYLRKEKEAMDRIVVEKASTFSTDYANPLDIAEKDFRHAAKVFKSAFDQLKEFRVSLNVHSILEKAQGYITDMDVIAEGLRSVRTIVYGIPAYPSLVMMDVDFTSSGLYRGYLCAAAIIHILMENGGKMTQDEFYSSVMCNSVYQQVFRTLMGNDYQDAVSLYQDVILRRSASTFNAYDEKLIWFKALKRTYYIASNCLTAPYLLSGSEGDRIWEFPFKLINLSLYIPNPSSAEEQFVKDMPETAQSLSKVQQEITKFKSSIRELSNPAPTQAEITAQRSIDQLRRDNAEIDMQIAKLRKKIFGKKKAAAEIQGLETKTKDNLQQISEYNNHITETRQQHATEIKEKKSLIEEQLANARRSLDGLQEQKSSYIQQFPQWICIVGEDSEI